MYAMEKFDTSQHLWPTYCRYFTRVITLYLHRNCTPLITKARCEKLQSNCARTLVIFLPYCNHCLVTYGHLVPYYTQLLLHINHRRKLYLMFNRLHLRYSYLVSPSDSAIILNCHSKCIEENNKRMFGVGRSLRIKKKKKQKKTIHGNEIPIYREIVQQNVSDFVSTRVSHALHIFCIFEYVILTQTSAVYLSLDSIKEKNHLMKRVPVR